MFNNSSGSRRWSHFHSALQLAVRRTAHKWTFEDFSECFPSYVAEDKNGAATIFNKVSDYIETQSLSDLDALFRSYNVQECIDTLHRIVGEAKERKEQQDALAARGGPVQDKDVWRDDIEPHPATCAQTIPVLESEAARLRQVLAKMEDENRHLFADLEEHSHIIDTLDAQTEETLKKVEAVRDGGNLYWRTP
ncbi:hypothetical protein FISHEDRAFT_50185 [Fistulina hepatica ATCC 64428]|uniref:Nnf1-domain-containing protein n=1 Tax=Fistulina hepatica ATCC 64428 TaxID=1128425 RepID=A0A0D7A1W2_9AGAR|nr:hypothetical protein FISHEDRAFT_50185 [Fistulina hepatica ATCC 64428]